MVTMAKWVASIALLTALSFIYYLNLELTTSRVLHIPRGSINQIITHLKLQNGALTSLDALLLRFIGMPQQGWIDMKATRLTHGDYLYRLCHGKAATRTVTLIPGETSWVFFKQMAKRFDLNHDRLMQAYAQMSGLEEGALVPETYQVPLGLSEERLVAWSLQRSRATQVQWLKKMNVSQAVEQNLSQWLTMASIIQKEAANREEMPIVASVIVNRIKRGMKLQMDGSLNYGSYSHVAVTAHRIRNDRSAYNTYHHHGLPPHPVCNVGFDALHAALFPATTDYYFFVLGKDGRHRFSRYYSTHKAHISHVTKRSID